MHSYKNIYKELRCINITCYTDMEFADFDQLMRQDKLYFK